MIYLLDHNFQMFNKFMVIKFINRDDAHVKLCGQQVLHGSMGNVGKMLTLHIKRWDAPEMMHLCL